MPSALARVVPPLLRLARFQHTFATPQGMHDRLAEVALRPEAYGPPARLPGGVRVTVDHATGWPVYVVAPAGTPSGQHVVYSHGGSWAFEISPFHWRLIARVVAESGATVTVPIYPLTPVGTAATVVPAVADLLADLVERHGAANVTAMGDSAGGQISLSAALLLRDRGVPPLRRTVLISPALDLSLANPEIDRVEPTDPWLARAGVRVSIDLWRDGLPFDDPRVSPLAGDLAGLGPITVFGGSLDITHPDIRLLVARARAAGVEVDDQDGPGMVHVWPLLPIPEARAARRVVVAGLTG
ncbi:esterase [Geodermatophilus sp. Leaf369]|uniref:alpha/beta hydrolase fold domain-containing protein n=1 Tax=Geodermatophilus sp. Leaf369 TaxID=1736354 RepID=UPI0006FED106|nr:alpha/beta hydrolase fold domain-containing protein [Geodermatophilus sp. Leaf369]KQS54563.1 esterase [Geodermatophilus sp. Leaf369]